MVLLNEPVWKFHEVPSPMLNFRPTVQTAATNSAAWWTWSRHCWNRARPTWLGLACSRLWSSRCAVWKGNCRDLKRIRWYHMSPHSSIQTHLFVLKNMWVSMPCYFLDVASIHWPLISSKFTTFQPLWRLQNRTSVVNNSCCTKTAQPLKMRNIMASHLLHPYSKSKSWIQTSVNWCIEHQNRTRLSWSSWSSRFSIGLICQDLSVN